MSQEFRISNRSGSSLDIEHISTGIIFMYYTSEDNALTSVHVMLKNSSLGDANNLQNAATRFALVNL